jgi:hypothetical protein
VPAAHAPPPPRRALVFRATRNRQLAVARRAVLAFTLSFVAVSVILMSWLFVGSNTDDNNPWWGFVGVVLFTAIGVFALFLLAARDLSRLLARSQVLKSADLGSSAGGSDASGLCLEDVCSGRQPSMGSSGKPPPRISFSRTISKQTLTVLKDARRGLFARTFKNAIMSESSSELELLERILVTVHVIACSVFAFIVVSLLFFISSFFRVLGLYLIAVLLWSCTGIPFSLAILRFFEGSAGAIARAKRPDGPQRQFSQPGDSAAADSVANGSDDPRGSSYTIDPNWHRSSCDMCSSFSGPEFADGGSRSPSGRRAKSRSTKVQWAERASDLVDKGAARIRAITPAFIKARASDPNDQTLMAGRRTAEVQPTGGLQEVSEESPRLSPGGSHGSGGDGAPRKPSARCKSEGAKEAPRLNHAEL